MVRVRSSRPSKRISDPGSRSKHAHTSHVKIEQPIQTLTIGCPNRTPHADPPRSARAVDASPVAPFRSLRSGQVGVQTNRSLSDSGCGPELARCGDGEPRFAVPPQGTKASRSMAHGAWRMSKRSIEACVLRQGEEQNVLDDHLDSILEPWPGRFNSAPAQAAARVGSRYRGLACSSPYLLKRSTNCQTRICLRRMQPAGLSTFAHLALLPRRFGA